MIILAVMLTVTGVLNYKYAADKDTAKILGEAQYVSSEAKAQKDAYEKEKMEREEAREESIKMLKDIIAGNGYSPEAKKDAEKKLGLISDYIRFEADCEAEIKSKGFKDIMVTVNEAGVSVRVNSDELLPTQIAQITDCVVSKTSVAPEKIKIITNN